MKRFISTHWRPRLVVLGLLAVAPLARSASGDDAPAIFQIGMPKIAFRNMNQHDVVAAMGAFLETEEHFRGVGRRFRTQVKVFDRTSEYEAAIREEDIACAIITTWDFLKMDLPEEFQPRFFISEQGASQRRYQLLTRRNAGFDSLESLRDQRLLRLELVKNGVGNYWFRQQFLKSGLGIAKNFLADIDTVKTPASAMLPVFFGSEAACVVDEPSVRLMTELNPQVGKQLQVLASSEPLADVVVCIGDRGWIHERHRRYTIRLFESLHETEAGRQLLALFKIDRFVPFQPAGLETVRQLQAEFERGKEQPADGAGTAALDPGPTKKTSDRVPVDGTHRRPGLDRWNRWPANRRARL